MTAVNGGNKYKDAVESQVELSSKYRASPSYWVKQSRWNVITLKGKTGFYRNEIFKHKIQLVCCYMNSLIQQTQKI